MIPRLFQWLQAPSVRDNFVPPFPDTEAGLRAYFERPDRDYFCIHYQDVPVGIDDPRDAQDLRALARHQRAQPHLNSGFGFELEGVFLEDARVDGRRVDVIRMSLLQPLWSVMFG